MPISEETRRRLSISHMGNNHNLGRKLTDEHRANISKSHKGQKAWNKGLKMSEEFRKKNSLGHIGLKSGSKHHAWMGGITPKNREIRYGLEIKLWREGVFVKYNFTCQKCLVKGGWIVAHHVLNFAEWFNFRTDINNGIVLCKTDHNLFHSIYGRKGNDWIQINEFLKMSNE